MGPAGPSETRSSLALVAEHRGAFGDDPFGRFAERAARFFGTPQYIVGQTVVVAAWIVVNSFAWALQFDARPFILLNLIFSTQAAYAAPLILLAQTRQADRDKHHDEAIDRKHTQIEEMTNTQTAKLVQLLQSNTDLTQQDKDLTEQVAKLTREIHAALTQRAD
jgi:uncharacterized membrane protein